MKKNVGPLLALYPMPVTVIGAMNKEKPTWTLVAHVGIIGHDRVLVSLAAPHFINACIKETKKLSINLVDEALLQDATYVGSVSGAISVFAALLDDENNRVRIEAPEFFRVIGKRRPEYDKQYIEKLRYLKEHDDEKVVRIHAKGAIKAIELSQ